MQGAHWAADQLSILSNACRVDNLVAAGLYALNSNGGTWSGETVPGNDHVLHRVCSVVIGEACPFQALLQTNLSMLCRPEDLWLLSG